MYPTFTSSIESLTFTFKSVYQMLLPPLFLFFLSLVIFLSVGNTAFVKWHCTQHILNTECILIFEMHTGDRMSA